MRTATVGFRAHSGWTALVALAIEKGAPVVLVRERVHLVETFTYGFRQPYHTAEELGAGKASAFVSRTRAEARRLAFRAIHNVQMDLRKRGYKLARCGLCLASGRPLPPLPKILASHSLIHAADGELFREALLHAVARCGLKAQAVKEREVLDSAARAVRIKPSDLARRVNELGGALGPPWTQDEKLASMVAWLALGSK
jgi:hypothetical protein